MIFKKRVLFFGLFLFLGLFLMPNFVFGENKNLCVVYITGIGCPNCAFTDAVFFSELTQKYPNLIIIEYEIYQQHKENSSTASEYYKNYNIPGYIPLLIVNKDKWLQGRDNVLKFNDLIKGLKNNYFPLENGSEISFKELVLTSLPGQPKIWTKNRVLIKKGDKGDNELLKKLLLTDDISAVLENINFEKKEPKEISLSGIKFSKLDVVSSIKFNNAVKLDDWFFQWNEQEIENNEAIKSKKENKNNTLKNKNQFKFDKNLIPLIGIILALIISILLLLKIGRKKYET
ncbi:MAG: hypothetical protein U9P88_02550 [Patescibacteria group bacterium]|nr:hypothetical protein [Patescibacteria group bacterium]